MNICKKCQSKFQGNYCSNCGHPQEIERINGRYVVSEIGSVLNFQRGIFFTIKELSIRPGESIKIFISKDRTRLVKPIMFILICSLVYAIFEQFFEFRHKYIDLQIDGSDSVISLIFQWISQNYGYANILMSIFVALWIKIFFQKYDYNFYEIFILLLFVTGMQMLMFSFLGALASLTPIQFFNSGKFIVMVYTFWATAQFFDKRKILNYLKVPISYFLGLITFCLVAIVIGLIIDLIK